MTVCIGLTGDVMIGRLVNEFLKAVPPKTIWGDLISQFHQTDLNLINLEAALTKSEKAVPKVFNFKSDPDNVAVLKQARIDVVNLANNHILDFSEEGLFETLETLDSNQIFHIGAGRNLEEARKPVIVERKGVKIGILGFTDNEPTWKAGKNHPGVNYLPVGDIQTALKDILPLRKQVDVLITTMHWGPNMVERPSPSFIDFAHRLIEEGVDIFHGHSAHIFQGYEIYQKGLILYDTGDFVDDYYVDPVLRNDRSFLFLVTVSKAGFLSLSLIPTKISDCCVNRANEGEAEEIEKRMQLLSKELSSLPL
ncbi:MAG: CapA family protein [Chlamydiales bacterium]